MHRRFDIGRIFVHACLVERCPAIVSEVGAFVLVRPLRSLLARARTQSLEFVCIVRDPDWTQILTLFNHSQSIRPMPRARSQVDVIIEQLATTRAHIQLLNQTLADQVSMLYAFTQCDASEDLFRGLHTQRHCLPNRRQMRRKDEYKNCT